MKFNSQICTTVEQSQRLLSLGLKKETADMVHYFSQSLAQDWTIVPLTDSETARNIQGLEIPAWSLHRLMCLVFNSGATHVELFDDEDAYEVLIYNIEWRIKKGYFLKEYLK